jgi:hypothetical protein
MYRSQGVAGKAITADGTIGVFALAEVSITEHGTLHLTFYRLTDSREPVSVRLVRLLTTRTMTEGRYVEFPASGVSNPVIGDFDYSTYFPAIPVQVEFSSGDRTWSREIELRPQYADSYFSGIGVEPKAPKTLEEFRAWPLNAPEKPKFAATERP